MMRANWSARATRQHVWPGVSSRSSRTLTRSRVVFAAIGNGRARRKPLQRVDIPAVDLQSTSSIRCAGYTDRQLVAASAIGLHEELHVTGGADPDGVIIG